ncbi:MAG: XTP/dITP diphosphatase [Desulfonauticus sp.]|nr:XTP/dITP diphosphatase [Desulfonauticus sp.]
MQLVLATTNKGKIKEISKLLNNKIELLSLKDFNIPPIPETGNTFEENAYIKAKTVSEKTGLMALADDSGLVVPYLKGEPGVHSARYSGPNATDEQNNLKLLTKLQNVPKAQRKAFFVCVIAVWHPSGKHFHVQGNWPGYIATEPKGHNGFGYDPIFIDEQTGLHAAEMSLEQKNQISHRALALKAFLQKWPNFLQQLQL